MSDSHADQIAKLKQTIAALEEQQRTLDVDLSLSLNQNEGVSSSSGALPLQFEYDVLGTLLRGRVTSVQIFRLQCPDDGFARAFQAQRCPRLLLKLQHGDSIRWY